MGGEGQRGQLCDGGLVRTSSKTKGSFFGRGFLIVGLYDGFRRFFVIWLAFPFDSPCFFFFISFLSRQPVSAIE